MAKAGSSNDVRVATIIALSEKDYENPDLKTWTEDKVRDKFARWIAERGLLLLDSPVARWEHEEFKDDDGTVRWATWKYRVAGVAMRSAEAQAG